MRSGMAASTRCSTFAGMAALPFGGVGDSGFGRIHGEDGLREFARAKAITRQRFPAPLDVTRFDRRPWSIRALGLVVRAAYGRAPGPGAASRNVPENPKGAHPDPSCRTLNLTTSSGGGPMRWLGSRQGPAVAGLVLLAAVVLAGCGAPSTRT